MPDANDKRAEFERKQASLRKKLKEARKLAGAKPGMSPGGGKDYSSHRDAMAEKSRTRSSEGREIGLLPPVKDPERRELCRDDLELFAMTYFPSRFKLPFASFHRHAIHHLKSCTQDGGLFVCALPRGSGKDTLAEVEVLRAMLYGFRKFVVLVAATERHAERSLKKIKAELEGNNLLLEDFPEACFPIRCLERINNRARGQTHNGKPTQMEWTADTLIFPHIDGSICSGAAIQVAGLTGAIRGLTILGPDGQPMRPDMVVVNDAQSRDSAKSPTQTADREAIISDDVLMLAGPTVTVAAVMLCTVIYRNDLSDRFLNSEKHPDWQSVRTKMLESFPTDMALWDEYADIRRGGMREGDKGAAGNAFYAANQAAMDAGGKASWPERKKKNELTGLQSAMNLYIDNRRGFFAEAQNDPEAAELASGAKELSADAIISRLNGVERFMVPEECTRLVASIDVGGKLHWYKVMGFNEQFAGSVVDYGTWPRQNRHVFDADDARPSLKDAYPNCNDDAQRVFAGLQDLTSEIMGRTYFRQGGGNDLQIEICLIDSGWEMKAVYDFVRQSPYSTRLRPSKGFARTTTSRGISEWKPRPGERKGYFWRLTAGEYGKIQCVQFDPDAWKSRVYAGLVTPPGSKTGLTLFGKSASAHEQLGNHYAAEYSTPVTLRGTTFDKWEIRPDRPDNHLLDTSVLCHVGASFLGLQWDASGQPVAPTPEPKPLKYSDIRPSPGTRVEPSPSLAPAPASGPAPLRYSEQRKRLGR